MSTMAFQITSVSIAYLTVCSGTEKIKYQSPVSLDFVGEILRWLVNSPHKGPVPWKMFPFDDVIMISIPSLPLPWQPCAYIEFQIAIS